MSQATLLADEVRQRGGSVIWELMTGGHPVVRVRIGDVRAGAWTATPATDPNFAQAVEVAAYECRRGLGFAA